MSLSRNALRARLALVVVAALAMALMVGPAAASAHKRGHDRSDRELTVMTQNLYLGSDLNPALAATTPTEFLTAVAQIYGTVQFTNFPARAQAIANEIKKQKPDLVGLQEVSKWTAAGVVGTPPSYDFLTILQSALTARGLDYEVASVADNALIGPVPLAGLNGCSAAPPFTCQVTLQDRDVILVNKKTHDLKWSNPASGRYAAQATVNTPVGPLSFDRGWTRIDVKYRGKSFKFANTHLEVEGPTAPIQEAQAQEFLAGPASGRNTLATGDFNSAADGSTTLSYGYLTAPGKFDDAWDESELGPGYSCCQNSTLTNFPPSLTSRIDLILTRGNVESDGDDAELIGATPFQAAPPLYPSDHAGVVADVEIDNH